MPGTIKPVIVILFEHELRAASEALDAVWRDESTGKTRVDICAAALRLAHAALYGITPETTGICVVSVKATEAEEAE